MSGTSNGWRDRHRRLTKKDLEILAPLFGFWNPAEFAKFIEIQDAKACRKNADTFDEYDEHIDAVTADAKRESA